MPKKTRVVIYLEAAQLAVLSHLKAATGASIAELCRRAVAEWISKHKPRPG